MLKICDKKCDQCLFSKNKIVSEKRKKEILKGCVDKDQFFECHKGTIKGTVQVCAGYFERLGQGQQTIQVLQRLEKLTGQKLIQFVTP